MNEKLNRIIESLEKNEKKYFIDDSGNIKEKINPGYSEKTGFYINENGEYVEETSALSFDQKTGVYEDEEGDIKEEGFFGSNKTGYYKGEKNEYKKEGFFGRSYKQKHESSNESSVPQDDISTIFFFVKWGVIIATALFIIMVAVFLAPIILLAWYLIKKREMQWVAIVGMVFSAYLIYDITSGGFITNSIMKMQQTGEEKYISLGYFIVLVTTLGFYIEKYTSKKIPVSTNGNFFEQKNIKERRPFIAGFSILLLALFSVFQFMNFSSNENNIHNPEHNKRIQINLTEYSDKIKGLLAAEERRNFNEIQKFYSTSIERYWNSYNINHSELLQQYQKSWKITSNANNNVQNIEQINDKTYVLNTIFKYYHLKQKKTKSVNSSVRFEFNENGKIIRVFQNK
jgi:hypothetical protein